MLLLVDLKNNDNYLLPPIRQSRIREQRMGRKERRINDTMISCSCKRIRSVAKLQVV